jgi:hypothetical protein
LRWVPWRAAAACCACRRLSRQRIEFIQLMLDTNRHGATE